MLEERIKDRSLILCFGLTGCGKSTLLNALLYGSESLEMTTHEEEMTLPNGQKKVHKRQVIDVRQGTEGFTIGHSRVTSETFIPKFIDDTDQNQSYIWVDIAGFDDTNGALIEYINTFIDKKIFNLAKDIKIVMPFTLGQVKDSRGGIFGKLIILMQNIF